MEFLILPKYIFNILKNIGISLSKTLYNKNDISIVFRRHIKAYIYQIITVQFNDIFMKQKWINAFIIYLGSSITNSSKNWIVIINIFILPNLT